MAFMIPGGQMFFGLVERCYVDLKEGKGGKKSQYLRAAVLVCGALGRMNLKEWSDVENGEPAQLPEGSTQFFRVKSGPKVYRDQEEWSGEFVADPTTLAVTFAAPQSNGKGAWSVTAPAMAAANGKTEKFG